MNKYGIGDRIRNVNNRLKGGDMMKPVQKETFYSNLDFFLKKKNIKKTDLEKGAGVSQGYLSRFLQKDDPDAFPSVSFLEHCSKTFGIPMDDLINTRFQDMSATEETIYKFIRKLIEETRNDDLMWTEISYWKIWNNIDESSTGEWNDFKKEPIDRDDFIPQPGQSEDEIVFLPAKELNQDGTLAGHVYSVNLYDDVRVSFLPISSWNGYIHDDINELTLWMEDGLNSYNYKRQCIARGNNDIFTALLPALEELKKIILERQKHVQIDKDFRDIICSYIDPKPPEPQPDLNDFDPDNGIPY